MPLDDKLPALAANSLSAQVYDHLKSAILAGRFHPGERIVPEDLAAHFGVSLTPIRDALKELEKDGLIKILARRGVFITEVSAKDVREIFQIRQIVEQAAVAQMDRVTGATVAQLQSFVREMERLQEGDSYPDYLSYAQLDTRFHQRIVALLDNDQLSKIYEGLRWPIQLLLVMSQEERQRATQGLAEHKAIVTAIAERDPAKAQLAIGEHLSNARDDLLRRLPSKD